VDEMIAWTEMVREDREQRIRKTKLALLDTAFVLAGQAKDLTHGAEQLDGVIAELRSPVLSRALLRGGVSPKDLVAAFVKANSTQNIQLRGQLLEIALDKLGKVKDVWALATEKSPDSEKLLGVLKLGLGLFIKGPRLQFLIIEADLATQYLYSASLGIVAQDRIEQLTDRSEEDLRNLKTLNQVLTADVKAMRQYLKLMRDPCL
jgi:hypothetical protein